MRRERDRNARHFVEMLLNMYACFIAWIILFLIIGMSEIERVRCEKWVIKIGKHNKNTKTLIKCIN